MLSVELIKAINGEWIRLYGGERVTDAKGLVKRIALIAEDRDCWLANHKALQKAYNKIDAELREVKEERICCTLGDCQNVATQYGYQGEPLCQFCYEREILE